MAENNTPAGTHLWEIRKAGRTYCRSSMTACGYDLQTLREMRAAGYNLYMDGQRVTRLA